MKTKTKKQAHKLVCLRERDAYFRDCPKEELEASIVVGVCSSCNERLRASKATFNSWLKDGLFGSGLLSCMDCLMVEDAEVKTGNEKLFM